MRYIVAIDQSTSASKAFLVDEGGFIVERGALEHKQHYPAPGRVEHDASEIWHNVQTLIDNLIDKAGAKNVAAIAIANQRETTVLLSLIHIEMCIRDSLQDALKSQE